MNYRKNYYLLLAWDTSLFLIVNCVKTSALVLNSDSLKMLDWAYHWMMTFNPDRAEQTQKAIFLKNTSKNIQPPLYNATAKLTYMQK